MTFVAGRRARAVNYGSFVHITGVPVAVDGIRPDGIDFDGELTAAEADNVWWWLTSLDDADEADRREIAALRAEAEAGTLDLAALNAGFAVLARYAARLGEAT